MAEPLRSTLDKPDETALTKQEEGVQVAVQWAQEKINNFVLAIESESKDPKLLNISYIISRRASVEVFLSKKSTLGEFVGGVIENLVAGKIAEGLTGLVKGAVGKLLGASSGSAKTDRVYEITFDELGGLNRLDAFIFSYCFTSSGLTDFTKAVIGVCIVRSAANMVDDNAYRVALTSSATIDDGSRKLINQHLIKVAEGQNTTLNELGERVDIEEGVLAGRARLAEVIGEGVAHSAEYMARAGKKNAGALVDPGSAQGNAQKNAQENASGSAQGGAHGAAAGSAIGSA